MGYAFKEVCDRMGIYCLMIGNPLNPPTAIEMFNEVKNRYKEFDVCIFTAAVCDYRFDRVFTRKIKAKSLNVNLIRNPDIAGSLKKLENQIFVGFALEDKMDEKAALNKLNKKNLDVIVLNTPQTFGSDFIEPVIIYRSEQKLKKIVPGKLSKLKLAERIMQILFKLNA